MDPESEGRGPPAKPEGRGLICVVFLSIVEIGRAVQRNRYTGYGHVIVQAFPAGDTAMPTPA
jgi:hypothetical protein